MYKEFCRTCRYYFIEFENRHNLLTDEPLDVDEYEAECRRFPPVRGDKSYYGKMRDAHVLHLMFSGPIVQAISWCGEWKKKDS